MKKNIRWNTMKILAAGFLGVILAGGVLLWLPACNTRPEVLLQQKSQRKWII